MKSIVIIPARLQSTRLSNKPLLKIEGVSMIRRTLDQVLKSGVTPVVVAADDPRILDEVSGIKGVYGVMTGEHHTCGTERVLEAYDLMNQALGEFDVIINVQGDEPFMDPAMIGDLLQELPRRLKQAQFWTTVTPLKSEEQADLNVAKVVMDINQNALIFSRQPLVEAYKHTSIYVYTPAFLRLFCSLPPSLLESAYRLEQMRALDHGYKLNCIPLPYDAVSINDESDLKKAGVQQFEVFQG